MYYSQCTEISDNLQVDFTLLTIAIEEVENQLILRSAK